MSFCDLCPIIKKTNSLLNICGRLITNSKANNKQSPSFNRYYQLEDVCLIEEIYDRRLLRHLSSNGAEHTWS